MARATIQDLEQQKAKLEAKQKQIENRIKDMKRMEGEKDRKARNHAMAVFGGLVESAVGDWRAVDYDELDRVLYQNRDLLRSCIVEQRETADATKELRAYEQRKREAGKRHVEQGDAS